MDVFHSASNPGVWLVRDQNGRYWSVPAVTQGWAQRSRCHEVSVNLLPMDRPTTELILEVVGYSEKRELPDAEPGWRVRFSQPHRHVPRRRQPLSSPIRGRWLTRHWMVLESARRG